MAVAPSKFIEIKTKKLIKSVTKELKKTTDAKICHKINKRELIMRSKISEEAAGFLKMILPH